jgi:hypothetical protein
MDQSSGGRRMEVQRQSVGRATEGVRRSELTLAPVGTAAVIQRAALLEHGAESWPDEGTAMMAPPTVQREASAAVAVADSPSPGATHATGTAATSSDTEKDMDELAGKLYDRIRGKLRTELLVDRERAGFLTDLR